MAEYADREHFIPVTKQELVELLAKEPDLKAEDAGKFREFAKLLQAIYHFEYHESLEKLKNAYTPFNPDKDTVTQIKLSPEEEKEALVKLIEEFGEAAESANFTRMPEEEMKSAFEAWSPFSGLKLKLDLEHYMEYSLYYRGKEKVMKDYYTWGDWFTNVGRMMFGKKPRQIAKHQLPVEVYKRLVLLAKIKHVGKETKKFDTQHVFVKLFKNVPHLDLEMLFPTTKPTIKTFDLVMILSPILCGILMMGWQVFRGTLSGVEVPDQVVAGLHADDPGEDGKATRELIESGALFVVRDGKTLDPKASFERIVELGKPNVKQDRGENVKRKGDLGKAVEWGLLAASAMTFIVAFGTWGYKSYSSYQVSKQRYALDLTRNLFYLNLDNNMGVFSALVDAAEEEECKEAFFAAFFLNLYPTHPETKQPWTADTLDDFIEGWIEKNLKKVDGSPLLVDFEVEDALGKLEKLELLVKNEQGHVSVKPWDQCLERVDYIWDNYFKYNNG